MDLEPGSLVADVGCGSGRYLTVNSDLYHIGCDVSQPVLDIARRQTEKEIVMCDNLHLPYRNGCLEAVISIAVIHHLATLERRVQAIREMTRVLGVGGKLMIYVWAYEQRHRKFGSQDILIPWKRPSTPDETESGDPIEKDLPDSDDDDDCPDGHSMRSIYRPSPTSGMKERLITSSFFTEIKSRSLNDLLTMVPDWGLRRLWERTRASSVATSQSPPARSTRRDSNKKHMMILKQRSEEVVSHSDMIRGCMGAGSTLSLKAQGGVLIDLEEKKKEKVYGSHLPVPDVGDDDVNIGRASVYRRLIESDHWCNTHWPFRDENLLFECGLAGFRVREFPQSSCRRARSQDRASIHVSKPGAAPARLKLADIQQKSASFDMGDLLERKGRSAGREKVGVGVGGGKLSSKLDKMVHPTHTDSQHLLVPDKESDDSGISDGSNDDIKTASPSSSVRDVSSSKESLKSLRTEAAGNLPSVPSDPLQLGLAGSVPELHLLPSVVVSDMSAGGPSDVEAILQPLHQLISDMEETSSAVGVEVVTRTPWCYSGGGDDAPPPPSSTSSNYQDIDVRDDFTNRARNIQRYVEENYPCDKPLHRLPLHSNLLSPTGTSSSDSLKDTLYLSDSDTESQESVATVIENQESGGGVSSISPDMITSPELLLSPPLQGNVFTYEARPPQLSPSSAALLPSSSSSSSSSTSSAEVVTLASSPAPSTCATSMTRAETDNHHTNVQKSISHHQHQSSPQHQSSSQHQTSPQHQTSSQHSSTALHHHQRPAMVRQMATTRSHSTSSSHTIGEEDEECITPPHHYHPIHASPKIRHTPLKVRRQEKISSEGEKGAEVSGSPSRRRYSSTSTRNSSAKKSVGGGNDQLYRYYHVFREGELIDMIDKYIDDLHIITCFYEHGNWCVVAEKVHVWHA